MTKALSLRLFMAALLTSTVLISCNKDDDGPKTPTERIVGKWSLVKEVEKRFEPGTTTFVEADTIDVAANIFTFEFRTDGKTYLTMIDGLNTDHDTLSYSFRNDSVLVIDDIDYKINAFTDNQFITSDFYNEGYYDIEKILTFSK